MWVAACNEPSSLRCCPNTWQTTCTSHSQYIIKTTSYHSEIQLHHLLESLEAPLAFLTLQLQNLGQEHQNRPNDTINDKESAPSESWQRLLADHPLSEPCYCSIDSPGRRQARYRCFLNNPNEFEAMLTATRDERAKTIRSFYLRSRSLLPHPPWNHRQRRTFWSATLLQDPDNCLETPDNVRDSVIQQFSPRCVDSVFLMLDNQECRKLMIRSSIGP